MKQAKAGGRLLSYAESAASSTVKTAADISAKAIIVLSETGNIPAPMHLSIQQTYSTCRTLSGETARLLAKFHTNSPILAICTDDRVARQIEGFLCHASSIHVGCT